LKTRQICQNLNKTQPRTRNWLLRITTSKDRFWLFLATYWQRESGTGQLNL